MKKLHMVANWKMNRPLGGIEQFCQNLHAKDFSCHIWIAPQAIDIPILLAHQSGLSVGAQNCSHYDSGAFTGEISPHFLKEMGAHFVIIGHSERRHLYGETNDMILAKLQAACRNGLHSIICVGETLEEREAGMTKNVIEKQLAGLEHFEHILLAYEPVWAIGTGKTATPSEAQEIHQFIRTILGKKELAILYGGSLNPKNAKQILSCPDIDGGLIGGASLNYNSFHKICSMAADL